MNGAGVAAYLGLSRNSASTISAWESGRREPSLRQLSQLAILYDTPLSSFTDPRKTDVERFFEESGGTWEDETDIAPEAADAQEAG